MADIQLTAQQRGAVEDRGGSLLVSAAAGSGKTKVLVERVFAYLTEEHCHIDDFLIITFTRAAAAELRTKLAAELAKRVAQDPENSHLRQQMFRVYQADIKTVDGFCAGLLREHIHLLEPVDGRSLTPDFRILDETEAGVLKQRALEDALEAFYQRIEQGDEGCRALAETLGFGRDDRALAALVPELHGKLQSHPYPDKWLERAAESWANLPERLGDSVYGRTIMEAYEAGQRVFGENRPQELAAKQAELPGDIEWHLIGGLQTNKVKLVAPFVSMIHSAESARLLRFIDKEARRNGRVIDVLLEVRIAREESKHGWDEGELERYLRSGEYRSLEGVRFRGLMGVATNTDEKEIVRAEFTRLRDLFVRWKGEFFDERFDTLSMGMSADYPLAVECGSTMVRIGSAIFGARRYGALSDNA